MPTREQYELAISMAERDGNMPARDALMRRAAAEMTGPASFAEKVGAGVQDVVLGTKQLFGQTTPDEIKEHNRYADQATGGTLGGKLTRGLGAAGALAPALLIPGAQSVGGAALLGGAAGLMEPTEDENVIGGKVKNAALGAATGGLMQKGLNVALPAAGQVLKRALGGASEFGPAGVKRLQSAPSWSRIPPSGARIWSRRCGCRSFARTQPYATECPARGHFQRRQQEPGDPRRRARAREAAGGIGDPLAGPR
jgi:hypothetical protein